MKNVKFKNGENMWHLVDFKGILILKSGLRKKISQLLEHILRFWVVLSLRDLLTLFHICNLEPVPVALIADILYNTTLPS